MVMGHAVRGLISDNEAPGTLNWLYPSWVEPFFAAFTLPLASRFWK